MAVKLTKNKASANPTKAFFVKMITRDILLEDCILDLIDNSVDGAWRSEGSHPMGLAQDTDLSKYTITLNLSQDTFTILDNCGGMTLDDAANHAFSFGRRESEEHDEYSIGVYGIGMKRAVFKLGSDIRIRSTSTGEENERLAFVVPINVATWLTEEAPPWDFDIETDVPLQHDGVEITVKTLTPEVIRAFQSETFLQNLRRMIAWDYTLHLNRGLKILLNGSKITGTEIELRQGEGFSPMRITYDDTADKVAVSIEIIGGMSAPPPDSSEPDEQDEGDKRYGWYIACNGRIVLAADKTVISGWGTDGWPMWHRQYSGFLGLILFTASDASALPLTTTKRNVDTSSEVFRRARPRMREVTKQWIAYTNLRKQSLEEAKQREIAATPVSIYNVQKMEVAKLPALTAKPAPAQANVNYAVPKSKLKKLAQAFGNINLSHRDVGIKSFDYSYNDLVGDE